MSAIAPAASTTKWARCCCCCCGCLCCCCCCCCLLHAGSTKKSLVRFRTSSMSGSSSSSSSMPVVGGAARTNAQSRCFFLLLGVVTSPRTHARTRMHAISICLKTSNPSVCLPQLNNNGTVTVVRRGVLVDDVGGRLEVLGVWNNWC